MLKIFIIIEKLKLCDVVIAYIAFFFANINSTREPFTISLRTVARETKNICALFGWHHCTPTDKNREKYFFMNRFLIICRYVSMMWMLDVDKAKNCAINENSLFFLFVWYNSVLNSVLEVILLFLLPCRTVFNARWMLSKTCNIDTNI